MKKSRWKWSWDHNEKSIFFSVAKGDIKMGKFFLFLRSLPEERLVLKSIILECSNLQQSYDRESFDDCVTMMDWFYYPARGRRSVLNCVNLEQGTRQNNNNNSRNRQHKSNDNWSTMMTQWAELELSTDCHFTWVMGKNDAAAAMCFPTLLWCVQP